MRNLKRVLSLGMTAAMITGLMVVGTSAAGYSDVSTEDNVEAIEVLAVWWASWWAMRTETSILTSWSPVMRWRL